VTKYQLENGENIGHTPDFSRRFPQLDGLRGVAIAMVVLFHYVDLAVWGGAPRILNLLIRPTSLGWSGVDLFFVLSGFLIGGILLDARESPNYFRVFYRRRAFRIFPLYFAFIIMTLIVAHFARSPLSAFFKPVIPFPALATFCQNFWMAIHKELGPVAVNPTWSLAVEEQFYLTLPPVIYLVSKHRLIWVLTAGIVLAPLIRLAIFLTDRSFSTAMYVLLPCRMDTLLLGVAAAYLLRRPEAWEFARAHRRRLWVVTELLTVVCVLLLYTVSATDPLTLLIGYDCVGLLFVFVLILCIVDESLAKVFQAKWLMGLGNISYCVYLVHPLAFGLVFAQLNGYPNGGAISAIIGLVVTIVVAKMSWDWFEKPLVIYAHRESYEPSASLSPCRLPI
jgi:peptidoglycan/LPS O-acetylase OafA/YrhL